MVATDARQQQLVDLQAGLEQLARESSDRERRLVDLQSSLEHLAHESSGREETLVALQQSVTLYTKWLVALTVVVALLGIGTIVVAAAQ